MTRGIVVFLPIHDDATMATCTKGLLIGEYYRHPKVGGLLEELLCERQTRPLIGLTEKRLGGRHSPIQADLVKAPEKLKWTCENCYCDIYKKV